MKRASGFTLIELMVTLAIAVILTTVAVPSFRSVIQDNRLTTTANTLVTTVTLARSEAVKRGQTVSVEPRSSSDWNTGWEVWVDKGGSDEVLLWTYAPLGNGSSISSSATTVQYEASGRVAAAACFDLALTGTSKTKSVDVEATGRASIGSTCP